jgi:hypothetical protein
MLRHRPDVPGAVPFLMQQHVAQLAAIQQRSANRASDKEVRFALYRLSANDLAFCHVYHRLQNGAPPTNMKARNKAGLLNGKIREDHSEYDRDGYAAKKEQNSRCLWVVTQLNLTQTSAVLFTCRFF